MRAVLTAEVATFRAEREEVMTISEEELRPIVADSLDAYRNGEADWFNDPIEAAAVLWHETFFYEQGRDPTPTELAEFQSATAEVLDRTSTPSDPTDPAQIDVITGWLSAYAMNSATAAGGGELEWVTRQDGDVRDIHVPLDGESVHDGGTFDVAGYRLSFPGEPVGPPHVWINCRCVVRQVKEAPMPSTPLPSTTSNTTNGTSTVLFNGDPSTFSTTTAANIVYADGPGAPAHPEIDDDPGEDDTGQDQEVDGEDYDELSSDVPWHGVIAPTGVMSGDRRKFSPDALRTRDLPLPVKFQKADDEGHKGAVVVANMTHVEERDGLIRAHGTFHTSGEANEAIDLIANQMIRGLSVDLDDATFELQYEDGSAFDMEDTENEPIAVVTDGRVASVTLCSIPAFQEAYIALGNWEDETDDTTALAAAGCLPCQEKAAAEAAAVEAGTEFAPGTHDGPGWATNPKETQRLRTYWTRGKGAAKIRWGSPGDFNRCRRQLAKYVTNPEYLAGTCANLHKEAMGLWPGQEGGKRGRHSGDTVTASAFTIVAAAESDLPDAAWFTDPHLPAPTPVTIEGRHIFGHVAAWTSCHTGYGISVGDGEVCVRPPNSVSGYSYFHTGQINTDAGRVNVGHITMDTGHAAASMAGRIAASHYDNTGAVVADVVCGEDQHGIWFSGALRTSISEDQRMALGAAALSGDWRRLGGNYELIAALAVNVPGFPIPRTAIAASGAGQYTLVAAGIVQHTPTLAEMVRTEVTLIQAADARKVLRAQTLARVHHLQADQARGRLAAIHHNH